MLSEKLSKMQCIEGNLFISNKKPHNKFVVAALNHGLFGYVFCASVVNILLMALVILMLT